MVGEVLEVGSVGGMSDEVNELLQRDVHDDYVQRSVGLR